MNAENLLIHYDKIADAPDAISRLRRFIFDLAVRGKLVPQDPNDEPASELLKRIAAEKMRLVKAKKIGSQAPFTIPESGDYIFDLPNSWTWCAATYPSHIISDRGKKIQTKDIIKIGDFPVVDQGKVLIRGYYNDVTKVIRVNTPIILFGDHTRETKLIDFDFVVGADGVKLLRPICINTGYYFIALQWLPIESRGYGRHFKLLKASFIPLPPLAEQDRIVAKVDELMALCDHIEEAHREKEMLRKRLGTASLSRINSPDPEPEAFQKDVAFVLSNFRPLTIHPDQIKALRQTILNLAVRGKLVPQDPNDEPASELLKRIAVQKLQLMRVEKIKKSPDIGDNQDLSIPFAIPACWRWTRFGSIAEFSAGRTPARKEPSFWNSYDYAWISIADMKDGETLFETKEKISQKAAERIFRSDPVQIGTIIMSFKLTIGKIARLGIPAYHNEAIISIRPYTMDIDPYLFKVLPFFALQGNTKGAVKGNTLNRTSISNILIPLPPLAEQRRIVAKIDELMALCGGLATSLTVGNDNRSRLLDAVLHEALAVI